MIKNIEELKNIQIVCRNQNHVEDCLNYLKQLGFRVKKKYYKGWNIIFFGSLHEGFLAYNTLNENQKIEFYNKEFVKTLQKLIKEKEKQEKKEDFEVASDGRIIKINNYSSEQIIYIACDYTHNKEGYEIFNLNPSFLDFALKYGLAYATEQARDRALFKLEIETKLKNIAERLNAGRKIDWEDEDQSKFIILYDYRSKILGLLDLYGVYCWKYQGGIYCLDKNFLDIAKQEIGEENLIKYFKD